MAEIKNYVIPVNLYRYRPLGDELNRELETIEQSYIYCPRFDQMNDPMEGAHRMSSIYQKKKATDEKIIAEAKNSMGIASLSEVKDHEPMWAHYADQFSGICISYITRKLIRSLAHSFDVVRMSYNEEPPVLLNNNAPIDDRAKLALSSKTVRWMSEREWRIIAPTSGRVNYDKGCVSRIYLGGRISSKDKAAVIDVAKKMKIRVDEMQLDKYQITFKPEYTPSRRLIKMKT